MGCKHLHNFMGCPHSLVILKKVCCCLYFCWSNFHHLLAKLMISTCLQYRPITSHYSKHNIKHHQWVTYICCLCFVWSNFHHLLAKLMISTCLHHQPSCQQLTPLKTQHQTSLMGHVHLLFLLCLVQFPPSLGQIDDLHMSTSSTIMPTAHTTQNTTSNIIDGSCTSVVSALFGPISTISWPN